MSSEQNSEDKVEYPEFFLQIKSLKQKDWIKACEKLDIWIAQGGGKGSHICGYNAVNCDRTNSTNLVITIQKNNLNPIIQIKLFKKLLTYGKQSGKYAEIDIWKALKIMK